MQEKLHENKVIAALEYKKEKARLLALEIPLKDLASSLIQNKAVCIAKQKEMPELDNVTAESKLSFEQTVQSLRSSIAGWKQMYMLTAPVSRKVAFSEPFGCWKRINDSGAFKEYISGSRAGTSTEFGQTNKWPDGAD
jgi:HlyD family secretion protein